MHQPGSTLTILSHLLQTAALLLLASSSLALNMDAFTPPAEADVATAPERVQLSFAGSDEPRVQVLRDDYGVAADPRLRSEQLPEFTSAFISANGELIPESRGLLRTSHPYWDILLEPGRIWVDDSGQRQFSLPFALQEKNANCTHNGVLRGSMQTQKGRFYGNALLASETCVYFKFDLEARIVGELLSLPAGESRNILQEHRNQAKVRLATRPIRDLFQLYPQLEPEALAGTGEDLSAWGLVVEGVHYVSDCPTRRGPFPFCDALSLPSYSLAKSLAGALGLMRLEARFPGSARRSVRELIPSCGHSWSEVNLVQLLNMQSGHYASPAAQRDEMSDAMLEGFFLPATHAEKITFACRGWPRRAAPGTTFVYHSSDTYLLGAAMNAVLREQTGAGADFYRDLVRPLWRQLQLSPALDTTRRTADARRQPFTGYGMTLLRDDIARIGLALLSETLAPELDDAMVHELSVASRTGEGLVPTALADFAYRHGFWFLDASELLSCEQPLQLPVLSGFGGINVVLLPDERVYYYFSDGGAFRTKAALEQLHHMQPLCIASTARNYPSTGTSS